MLLLGRELVPGGVSRNAGGLGMAHQVVLAFLPGWGLHRLDRAGTQGELVVGNHQAVVHADHAAEAPAGLASTDGRVEREDRGDRIGVAQVAVGAVQSRREAPQLGIRRFRAGGHHVDVQSTRAALERHLDRLDHTGFFHLPDPEAVGNHVQHLDHPHAPRCAWFAAPRGGARLFGAARHGARTRPDRTDLFPLGLHAGEAAGRQPLLQLLRAGVGRQFHRKGQHQPRLVAFGAAPQQFGVDRLRRVVPHRLRGLPVEQLARARKQQLQVVVQLGHRAHGGARAAHRVGLVDGDGRRHAFDLVDGGLVHAVQELPRIGREGFDVAALPFCI